MQRMQSDIMSRDSPAHNAKWDYEPGSPLPNPKLKAQRYTSVLTQPMFDFETTFANGSRRPLLRAMRLEGSDLATMDAIPSSLISFQSRPKLGRDGPKSYLRREPIPLSYLPFY